MIVGASEFNRGSPSTSMTPICNRAAKAMFPVLEKHVESEEDPETSRNSSLLDEIDKVSNTSSQEIRSPAEKKRYDRMNILKSKINCEIRRRRSSIAPKRNRKSSELKRKRRHSALGIASDRSSFLDSSEDGSMMMDTNTSENNISLLEQEHTVEPDMLRDLINEAAVADVDSSVNDDDMEESAMDLSSPCSSDRREVSDGDRSVGSDRSLLTVNLSTQFENTTDMSLENAERDTDEDEEPKKSIEKTEKPQHSWVSPGVKPHQPNNTQGAQRLRERIHAKATSAPAPVVERKETLSPVTSVNELFQRLGISFEDELKRHEQDHQQEKRLDIGKKLLKANGIMIPLLQSCIQVTYVESFVWGRDELRSFEHLSQSEVKEKIQEANELRPAIFEAGIIENPKDRQEVCDLIRKLYQQNIRQKTSEYYVWRTKLQESVKKHLAIHLELLEEDIELFQSYITEEAERKKDIESQLETLQASFEAEEKLSGVLEAIEEQFAIEEDSKRQVSDLEQTMEQLNQEKVELQQQLAAVAKQLNGPIVTSEEVRVCTEETSALLKQYQMIKQWQLWQLDSLDSGKMQLHLEHPDESKTWFTIQESSSHLECAISRTKSHSSSLTLVRRLESLSHWLFDPRNVQDRINTLTSWSDVLSFVQESELVLNRKHAFFKEVKDLMLRHHVTFEVPTLSLIVWFTKHDSDPLVHFPVKFNVNVSKYPKTNVLSLTLERPIQYSCSVIQYGNVTPHALQDILANQSPGIQYLTRVCQEIQSFVNTKC